MLAGDVSIQRGPHHQRVQAGMDVRFMCEAAADSLIHGLPVIEWRRDDELIDFSTDTRFTKSILDSALSIRNTTTLDTGLYTCVAAVGGESVSRNAQLIVEGEYTLFIDPILIPAFINLMHHDKRFVFHEYWVSSS